MFKYIKFTKVSDAFTTHTFRVGDEPVRAYGFDADVVALESEDVVNIDAVIASQNDLINCTEISYDEFKDVVRTTAQYARVKHRVEEKYNADVAVLTSLYPLHERETWATQLEQAKKFLITSADTDAPFLKTLADAEGGTVADFAQAVIVKSEAYQAFMAQALATKRAYEKELMSEIGL